MKRKLICAVMAMLALLSVTACDGDGSTTDSAANDTTKLTTTTKETTTTKKTYYMSESEAISIAKERVESKYAQYSPVVIGEVNATDRGDYWSVNVRGHYWKNDAFGHNTGSQDFSTMEYVYKSDSY